MHRLVERNRSRQCRRGRSTDALWIKLVDTELQDTVADVQKNDELAQEALRGLTDPLVSPSHWTIVPSEPDSSTWLMFYNGHLYIPDNLGL